MQFLRIAGDDAEKGRKKRVPKVQKLHLFYLYFVYSFLISTAAVKSISLIDRKNICLKLLQEIQGDFCISYHGIGDL